MFSIFRLDWAYNCISYLSQKTVTARIILQIIFCHPPGSSWGTSVTAQPIRYICYNFCFLINYLKISNVSIMV